MTQSRPPPVTDTDEPARPGLPPPRHEATLRRPAWRRGASVESAVGAVLVTVERIRAEVAAAEDAAARDPDRTDLAARLEDAVIATGAALDGVIGLVDQLEQYALSAPQRARRDVRLRAVRTARALDWATQPTEAGRAAGARIEQALVELDTESDDVERGFEDLRSELRRLQRALRDVARHRADRPMSVQHLRRLTADTLRVLDTAAVGLLAALRVALRDGASAGDTAIAAATGAAVRPRCERLTALVRQRMRPPAAAERLAAVHDDLTYLVGDFARACAGRPPDRDVLEDLYGAALLQSSHAARSAQRLGWTAAHDYAVTARQVPVVLAAAMAAVRAGDTDALAGPAEAVAEVHVALTRYRTPRR